MGKIFDSFRFWKWSWSQCSCEFTSVRVWPLSLGSGDHLSYKGVPKVLVLKKASMSCARWLNPVFMEQEGMCVVSGSSQRNGNTECWLEMPSRRANRSLFVQAGSLPAPSFVCFLFSIHSQLSNRTCMSRSISLAAHLLGRNNKKPKKNRPEFTSDKGNHKPGKSSNQLWVRAQTAATIPTNYSWFMSQPLSWRAHSVLMFADQISLSHGLFWHHGETSQVAALTLHNL